MSLVVKFQELGFGSNQHYAVDKALRGIPVGKHRVFFGRLVALGLIDQQGNAVEQLKTEHAAVPKADMPATWKVTFHEVNRHMTITARDAAIDTESMDAVLRLTEAKLEGAKFATTWDLRDCRMPSMDVTARCLRWALKNKRRLDDQNERLVVLGGSSSVNSVVRLVLSAFGPRCPTLVTNDANAAHDFMKTEPTVYETP